VYVGDEVKKAMRWDIRLRRFEILIKADSCDVLRREEEEGGGGGGGGHGKREFVLRMVWFCGR